MVVKYALDLSKKSGQAFRSVVVCLLEGIFQNGHSFYDRSDGILDNREEKPPASLTSYGTTLRQWTNGIGKLFYGLPCDIIPGGNGLPFCDDLVKP